MINNLELSVFNENDIDNLKYISEYWRKDLNKAVKKTNKWVKKFRGDYDQFELPLIFSNIHLITLSEKVILFRNFLNQKYNIIKSGPKFLNKFSNFISHYCSLVGYIESLKTIMNYIEDLKNKTVDNRNLFFTKKANEYNKYIFEKFKNIILTTLKNDEYLDMLFSEMHIIDEKIDVFNIYLNQIMKYINSLFKKKKISEKELTDICSECIEFGSINTSYSYCSIEFLKKI